MISFNFLFIRYIFDIHGKYLSELNRLLFLFLNPISIYDESKFSEAKPNIEYAFRKSLAFTLTDGMNDFNNMIEEINENYFLPDFVRDLVEFINNSSKNRRNSKKSNCISKNRNGEPCKAPPIRGTPHCMFHTKKYQKGAYVTRSG